MCPHPGPGGWEGRARLRRRPQASARVSPAELTKILSERIPNFKALTVCRLDRRNGQEGVAIDILNEKDGLGGQVCCLLGLACSFIVC